MVVLKTEYKGLAALSQKLAETRRNLCNSGWYSVSVISQYFTHSIFLTNFVSYNHMYSRPVNEI